ncbi:MAG: PBSX family phage terminase large subunit [Oscillospiraceae bacterium]|nr:PBSX family phage terminase large subunit [Oscillospiraceae bacterium]
MIYRSFSKRQILAMTWWNRPGFRDCDGIICDGAVRSGKTVCMTDGFFLWSMSRFNGQVFGICGKTVVSLRRNIISNLQQWLGGILDIREYPSQSKLVVRNRQGHQNTYYLFGGENESSYKLIQGITLAGALLDEVALMPRSFVEQACARCSVTGSKLWFNCNPAGPEHWFYKEWVKKTTQKNMLRLHFTMADNPGLDPAIRRRYETLYTGVFYRRYILGQWCMAEGLVYSFDQQKHITEEIPQKGRYYISVDYGTRNPFSAGLWCVAGGKAVRIREFYHNGRAQERMLTDEEYYRKLEELAGDKPVEQVIVDPSAASFIATIRAHGRFSVRKAKNEVLTGIRLVSSLLQAGVLQFSGECRDTIREFSLYRWEEKGEKDAPCKENDHAMDDVRYFCATVLRREAEIMKAVRKT